MKKIAIFFAALLLLCPTWGQGKGTPPQIPAIINDYGIYSITFSGVKYEKVDRPRRKYKPFNPKKDDINNVYIEVSGNGQTEYEIIVAHKNGRACDMNEFSVRFEGDNIQSEELTNYYKYSIKSNTMDYLDGSLPMEGDIVITHIESNLSTRIHYVLNTLPGDLLNRGKSHRYLFEPVRSNVFSSYFFIVDLDGKYFVVVKDKGCIDASGMNGRDGRDGYNGINGLNERTWTDKNGKSHYSKGTLGTAGGNGGDGENGQDGGKSYVYVGPNCPDKVLTVRYSGGKGGRGGKGGIGGLHGKGSGKTGRAPNGYPGRNGANGTDGEVKFDYISKADILLSSYTNGTTKIVSKAPYILVDKTVKMKRKKGRLFMKRKSSQIQTDSSTVDF